MSMESVGGASSADVSGAKLDAQQKTDQAKGAAKASTAQANAEAAGKVDSKEAAALGRPPDDKKSDKSKQGSRIKKAADQKLETKDKKPQEETNQKAEKHSENSVSTPKVKDQQLKKLARDVGHGSSQEDIQEKLNEMFGDNPLAHTEALHFLSDVTEGKLNETVNELRESVTGEAKAATSLAFAERFGDASLDQAFASVRDAKGEARGKFQALLDSFNGSLEKTMAALPALYAMASADISNPNLDRAELGNKLDTIRGFQTMGGTCGTFKERQAYFEGRITESLKAQN